jgi:hypothetical protein
MIQTLIMQPADTASAVDQLTKCGYLVTVTRLADGTDHLAYVQVERDTEGDHD